MYRDHTKVIQIGNKKIGGGNPILIQSMTNTKTEDVQATVEQILALEAAGCDIIRCAVPTMEAAKALKEIKKQIHIPLVADIHFDYRLAIAAMENGADKIRINPGNIGSTERIKAVVDVAKERNIPIRVGVNSGSLEKELVEKYHGVTAEGLVESALDKVHIIEELGYDNLVISIKSSDVMMCARAHELIAEQTSYPLHVGITEAGTLYSGNIKSAIGLGIILYQGIGDMIEKHLENHLHEGEEEHMHTHVLEDGTTVMHSHGEHGHHHSHAQTKAVLNRLSRAIGHLESIKRMVEDGRDCSEVLIQLSAVKSAINNTGKIILQDHIEHCIVDAVEHGDKDAIKELERAIDRFMK